ncbi:MAG: Smr/MutS family protein [Hyphomicrobiales bacterium]
MSEGMRRRRGRLSAEDVKLWRRVAEQLTPLPGRRLPPAEPEPETPAPQAPKVQPEPERRRRASTAVAAPPAAGPKLAPLAPIDRRTLQKLVRGSVAIDDRIDLHGMTQSEAHGALRGFLVAAQKRGARMVLVITGKGRPLDIHHHLDLHHDRGVLKRVVPKWLRLPELRPIVLSVEDAHAAHGGEGALYVRLRKRKG